MEDMDNNRSVTMPSDQDLNRLFAEASKEFLNLYKQSVITEQDIAGRSWMERFTIAAELWLKCDRLAQKALASDPHEAVSVAAHCQINTPAHRDLTAAGITGGINASQATI